MRSFLGASLLGVVVVAIFLDMVIDVGSFGGSLGRSREVAASI